MKVAEEVEIRRHDSTGKVERTIASNEPDPAL